MNGKIIARIDNATKMYGEVVAVSEANFSIEKGKIIGFLGPNGSGKTTAIRMLLGLLKPQSGEVSLFGKNPFTNSSVRHLIGYISENGNHPKWLKARDYLISMARFHMDRKSAIIRADEILKEIGLEAEGNKQIRKFSKGMKQRIKIGQALIHKPALVIADEPFNGLDPVVRRDLYTLFKKYQTEYNTTFFISSHILFEMEKMAEKIILLYKGRTIAQGSPLSIRGMIEDQPHSIQISVDRPRELSTMVVNHADRELISQIKFQKDSRTGDEQIVALTHKPRQFYEMITDLVVDNKFKIKEIRSTDEGLESLFNSLTEG